MGNLELKKAAARLALERLSARLPGDAVLGVGTGSTVNCFIDALAAHRSRIARAVSSSEATTARLRALGIEVVDANEAGTLAFYVDGADEIDEHGYMIKGGGGALTREKIVAAQAQTFICIADASKRVSQLGRFPLPVEIIPMAAARIIRDFAALGGDAVLRERDGKTFVTDNGQHILDVHGLTIDDPPLWEQRINQWAGVVTVGIFARQRAHECALATPQGAQMLEFPPVA